MAQAPAILLVKVCQMHVRVVLKRTPWVRPVTESQSKAIALFWATKRA